MRTLGLLGGCSAEATSLYYAGLNRGVRARRPGHGARIVMVSFDVEEIDSLLRGGDWDEAGSRFAEAGRYLQEGGAEAVLIATNTMHKVADRVAAGLDIPLLHIADIASAAVRRAGRSRPLLLGTRYLMTDSFYQERLAAAGLEVSLPSSRDQDQVHAIIYEELMDGRVTEHGRSTLAAIVERGGASGADSVILACTELGLALRDGDVSVPVFDTAALHVAAGVAFALREGYDGLPPHGVTIHPSAPGAPERAPIID